MDNALAELFAALIQRPQPRLVVASAKSAVVAETPAKVEGETRREVIALTREAKTLREQIIELTRKHQSTSQL
jgi:hypothetical protein